MDKEKGILFTKMHGLGNDYIYIHCPDKAPASIAELAVVMSDRHCGVGGDGIILILPSTIADFKMRIFNADGSEATMCGNGSRCVAKYVYDNGLTDKKVITLETLAGVRTLTVHTGADGLVEEVTVDMGIPCVDPRPLSLETTLDGDLTVHPVSMGNPHAVAFVDSIDDIHFDTSGPELERHPIWPDRANIEFAHIDNPGHITVRVWERGSGETMACGTGACAVAAAAMTRGLSRSEVTIKLPGGSLAIRWDGSGHHLYMRGPATTVFTGRYIPKK